MGQVTQKIAVHTVDDDFIWFSCSDQKLADVKLGASYNETKRLWKIPNTVPGLKEITRYFNHPKLMEYIEKKKARRDMFVGIKKQENTQGDPRLRSYQRVDVEFLSQIPHAGLFNQQRTGKTPTVLGLVNKMGYKKVGIVAPASTLYQWQDEVKRWTGRDALVIRGRAKDREKILMDLRKEKDFIFIVSYDTMKRDVNHYRMTFDALILDEAHRLRGRTTQQAKAAFKLGKKVKHRYALTGTPSVRGADDLWSILHFLYPEKFPSYWQFVNRYMKMGWNPFVGVQATGEAKRAEELQEILALISVNRKQQEVMKWLPAKTRIKIPLEATDKQRSVYSKVERTFTYKEDGKLLVDVPNQLAQLIRLRQIAVDPGMLGIEAKSAKTEYIKEWLQDNPGEPVLIFSTFSSYLTWLEMELSAEGYQVGRITGDVTAKQRKKVVDQFQQGKLQVLLLNIKAAGEGLTLDRATTAIFVDRAFNPAENAQAEDRMTPTTEEKVHPMTIITLMIRNTYDEKVELILDHKYDVTEVINSGGIQALDRLYEELKEHGQATPVSTVSARSVLSGELVVPVGKRTSETSTGRPKAGAIRLPESVRSP